MFVRLTQQLSSECGAFVTAFPACLMRYSFAEKHPHVDQAFQPDAEVPSGWKA
jgi:hypothetical protein